MQILIHILIWGSLLTLCSFVILIGSWVIDPKIWGADLGVAPKYQNRIGGLITVAILLVVQTSIIVFATRELEIIKLGSGFWFALLINYLIYQVFNLLDLIVLDWFIYIKMKPSFMRPDYLPVADKLSKHLVDFLNGLLIALLPVALSTGIGFWI